MYQTDFQPVMCQRNLKLEPKDWNLLLLHSNMIQNGDIL